MISLDPARTHDTVTAATQVAPWSSTWRHLYLLNLVLEGLDIFERVDDDLVDGVVHGLDLDVDEGFFGLLGWFHWLIANKVGN